MMGAEEVSHLKELHAKGFKIKQIARMTGHDPVTVRKHIYAQKPPQYKPRPVRPSKLDPFKAHLLSRIQDGMLNCSVLLDEIRTIANARTYGCVSLGS